MKYKLILVLICLFALVTISIAGTGFPKGYVGGCMMPNGDVVGGHPSEEQMALHRYGMTNSPTNIYQFEDIGIYEPVPECIKNEL